MLHWNMSDVLIDSDAIFWALLFPWEVKWRQQELDIELWVLVIYEMMSVMALKLWKVISKQIVQNSKRESWTD